MIDEINHYCNYGDNKKVFKVNTTVPEFESEVQGKENEQGKEKHQRRVSLKGLYDITLK
jgi:hypothetical protein